MKDNVLLITENMSRKYVISDRRETEIEVLKDINLEIREQEFISIMGITDGLRRELSSICSVC